MNKKQPVNNRSKARKKQSGHKVCVTCGAVCCKDLAIQIERPATRKELDDLKWQLHFDTVRVYITGKKWYLLVNGRCRYLDKSDRCIRYQTRPQRCIRHNPPDCERFGKYYDVMLTTPEELEDYYHPKYYPLAQGSTSKHSCK